ncbi:MAG TPA: FHA domain-containing protein [Gemmatimonadaceae bacterium]|jgi:pSer/pThr/pTyr-binding forkhead associated (FHA) protein/S1-C subfamily serine protease
MPRIVLKELESDKTLSVNDVEATLGRDPASGFVIEGPNAKVVSGRHARIFFQDSSWWIEDSSRNGTILDEERLQQGQRHALKVGQLIGLGESGPRYRVLVLESRRVAETVMELPDLNAPVASTTAPRSSAPVSQKPPAPPPPTAAANLAESPTAAMRHSEAVRAGLNLDEATEPMAPSPDWLVHVVLRATSTNQRFDVRSQAVKIGRSPDCNIQIPPEQGASVSRIHCEIAIEEGGVVVRDAGSRNGTFVNGKKLDALHPAVKGDFIMLGSGGPQFAIEDLHIVKPQAGAPSLTDSGESTPVEGKRGAGAAGVAAAAAPAPRVEPRTDPSPKAKNIVAKAMGPATNLARRSFAGAGRTAFFKDVLEDMSKKSAKRVRIIVWASVGTTVVIAAILLGVTQWRVSESERRMSTERARLEARSDSIRKAATAEAGRLRASFDSARSSSAPRAVVDSLRNALADASRRTGVLEQALVRARQSLDQQLAAGDSARRRAEEEMIRLRAEVGKAQAGGEGSRAGLDSLRRALRLAEEREKDVAIQMRAVRGANLAQVAQLNQGAVGLLFYFFGPHGDSISTGSGFAITPSGYFVTNRHVVTDKTGAVRDTIYLAMADQTFNFRTRIAVVAVGTDADLAIVKIPEYRGPYVKKIDWEGTAANQGAPAALIGFPYGTGLAFDDTASRVVRTSMTAGIFSKVAPDFIQFGGITAGGASGSPIFNASGEVVGVHRAGLADGPGMGFAVPVAKVLKILPADAKSELGIPGK